MKQLILYLALATMMLVVPGAMHAQKHRHNPQIVQAVDDATDTLGLEAYSDTTSTVISGANSSSIEDDIAKEVADEIFSDLKNNNVRTVTGIIGGVLIVLLVLLFLLAPFILIAVVIYLLLRTRNRRYQIAEKAIENGQEIPRELLVTERQSDDLMWKKGIRNLFLGAGLAILFHCWDMDFFAGFGWLLALYGVGQAVIAKSSSKRSDDKADDMNLNN